VRLACIVASLTRVADNESDIVGETVKRYQLLNRTDTATSKGTTGKQRSFKPAAGIFLEAPMPRYRFTTDDGDKLDVNDDWLDFLNDDAAAQEAQRVLADTARDQLPDGPHLEMRISVENELGEVVYQASLDFHGETAGDMKARAYGATGGTAPNGRSSNRMH